MSPSSKGVIPGLFLALVAAVAVLAMNGSWLLPAVDDTGAAYLVSVPMIATGAAPVLPWAPWDSSEPTSELEDRGSALPLMMAALMRVKPSAHIVGLWAMALSASALFFAVGWVAGGVAGMSGALVAGLLLGVSGPIVALATTIRPELLAMALVALQLGMMTYQPRWSLAHGLLGAMCWLAHPVGAGAVAAAVLWPFARPRGGPRRVLAAGAALLPTVVLFASSPLLHGLLKPPSLGAFRTGLGTGILETTGGLLVWAGGGFAGPAGLALGLLVVVGATAWVLLEARATPTPPADVHWSDPAAPDLLAESFRPAAGLLALALVLPALAGVGGSAGSLGTGWTPVLVPTAALLAAAVTRSLRRHLRPAVIAGAGVLALWMIASGWTATAHLQDVHRIGRGHTAAVWIESKVIRWVDNRSRAFPTIYASSPALLIIVSGQPTRGLPAEPGDLDAFAEHFRRHPGALVVTGTPPEGLQVSDYLGALDVTPLVDAPEGTVLVPRGAAASGGS